MDEGAIVSADAASSLPDGYDVTLAPPDAHRIARPDEWPWLPVAISGILARHPYCSDCGLIRAVGADRALDMGGIANLLGRFGRLLRDVGLRFTDVQRRLVVQRFKAAQGDDPFGLSRGAQLRLLSQVVAETLGLNVTVAGTYLRSC